MKSVLTGVCSQMTGIGSLSAETLLWIFIAFASLVLIILFVILQRILPLLNEMKPDKQAEKQVQISSAVDSVISQIAYNEEKKLMEDAELVAVITAAICASMGNAVPADGLIVRSIRKVNRY